MAIAIQKEFSLVLKIVIDSFTNDEQNEIIFFKKTKLLFVCAFVLSNTILKRSVVKVSSRYWCSILSKVLEFLQKIISIRDVKLFGSNQLFDAKN